MSEAKVSLLSNPFYIPEDEEKLSVKSYSVVMFKITPGDDTGDRGRYEKFIMSTFPYNRDSRLEVIDKRETWTKEGYLIICIDYVEMVDELKEETPEDREY